MNNEEFLYQFDCQGYVVLKNVLSDHDIETYREILSKCARDPNERMKGCTLGKVSEDYDKKTDEVYLSNIIETSPLLYKLINIEPVLKFISNVTLGLFRLNHTYSIERRAPGGYTHLHMGGAPIHPKAAYMVNGRQIFSSTTKVVFPLAGTFKEDGCFAAIPGSHKANFERPWGSHPMDNCSLIPIETNPGDAIIFTEALAHGSMIKVSEKLRQTIYLCYSVGYMPDWGKLQLGFSESFINDLDDDQRRIVSLKDK